MLRENHVMIITAHKDDNRRLQIDPNLEYKRIKLNQVKQECVVIDFSKFYVQLEEAKQRVFKFIDSI